MHQGSLDEALLLFQQAVAMREEDDDFRYIDGMAMVRIHFDKGAHAEGFRVIGDLAATASRVHSFGPAEAYGILSLAKFGELSASVQVPEFLDALAQYESRFLADKNLGLAELWRQDPERGLDILLEHSPHPPPPWERRSDEDSSAPAGT